MGLEKYYRALTKRAITPVSDGGGGFTETPTDTTIYGYIATMSSYEKISSAQLKEDADAKLFTDASVSKGNRIIDTTNYSASKTYEVVGEINNYPNRYTIYKLKTVAS